MPYLDWSKSGAEEESWSFLAVLNILSKQDLTFQLDWVVGDVQTHFLLSELTADN